MYGGGKRRAPHSAYYAAAAASPGPGARAPREPSRLSSPSMPLPAGKGARVCGMSCARLCIYDPKVTEAQVRLDLATAKFEWDHPVAKATPLKDSVEVLTDPMEAARGAHAICVLTEWDEFKAYDYQAVYDAMVKPAFIFDGRNILDHAKLRDIGFIVYALGKPLDPFLQNNYS